MAGDWIKMTCNLHENPKVVSMASDLGVDELHVIGMLWRIWSWADAQTVDGNAVSVTTVTLDRFARCNGFADALRKVGWLEGRDNALTFPRFAEHNGQTAKERAQTQKRVGKSRDKKRNAQTVTHVTHPPLPEKRREEYIERENISAGAEGSGDKPEEPLIPHPSDFAPPTLEEVKRYAQTFATPELAESFWNSKEQVGWVDRNGNPIRKWKPAFTNYVNHARANEHQRKQFAGQGRQSQTPIQTERQRDEARTGLKQKFNMQKL